MKVLLVNPPGFDGIKFVREGRCAERESAFSYSLPPHSLLSIASVMRREGIDVNILDSIAERKTFEDLEGVLRKSNYDVILINTIINTMHSDTKVAELAKKHGIFSAFIGIFPTAMDVWCLKNSKADAVIRNEPEITALHMVKALDKKIPLENVRGITFKSRNRIKRNKARPFEKNMETFRIETRDMIDNSLYKMPFSNDPVALVAPSRGCPYKCTFCAASIYYGNELRCRKAGSIFEEICEIYHEHKIRDIGLWAEVFLRDKKNFSDLLDLLRREKMDINLYTTSRVDIVDYATMREMKSVGFRSIAFGIESGSQKILNRARKGTTVRQSFDSIKSAKKSGLQTVCHMVLGLPGETKQTMGESLEFAVKSDPDFFNFYIALPYPGTEFYEEAIRNKWIKSDKWDEFEINKAVISYDNLTAEEIEKFRQKAFLKFYLRPGKMLNTMVKIPPHNYLKFFSSLPNFAKDWIFTK